MLYYVTIIFINYTDVELKFTNISYTINEDSPAVQVCVEIVGGGVIVQGVHVPFVIETVVTNITTAIGKSYSPFIIISFKYICCI